MAKIREDVPYHQSPARGRQGVGSLKAVYGLQTGAQNPCLEVCDPTVLKLWQTQGHNRLNSAASRHGLVVMKPWPNIYKNQPTDQTSPPLKIKFLPLQNNGKEESTLLCTG
jgi:hypothetical protein